MFVANNSENSDKKALVRKVKKVVLYLFYSFNVAYRKKTIIKIKEDDKKSTILLTHFGGGTQKYDEEHYSKKEIIRVAHCKNKIYSLVFFDKKDTKNEIYITQKDLYNLLENNNKDVVVGSLFGYINHYKIIETIVRCKEKCNNTVLALVHDYHSVCPSLYLIMDGYYCGLKCDRCLLISTNDIAKHREIWGKLYGSSDYIICFSKSSEEILRQTYKEIGNKIVVQPHNVDLVTRSGVNELSRSKHMGIVGNIYNEAKGLTILRKMIPCLDRSIQFSFIGNTKEEIGIDLENVHYYGRYTIEELPRIVEKAGINCFIFPSVCPETFSYVVSEIMQFDMPIIAFRIGAQGEKVGSYAKGILVDSIQEMKDAIQDIDIQINRKKYSNM